MGQQQRQRRQCAPALGKAGGQRRAGQAPLEALDEQPVQKDVAQKAAHGDGHGPQRAPRAAHQRQKAGGEHLAGAEQADHPDVGGGEGIELLVRPDEGQDVRIGQPQPHAQHGGAHRQQGHGVAPGGEGFGLVAFALGGGKAHRAAGAHRQTDRLDEGHDGPGHVDGRKARVAQILADEQAVHDDEAAVQQLAEHAGQRIAPELAADGGGRLVVHGSTSFLGIIACFPALGNGAGLHLDFCAPFVYNGNSI